MEGVREEVRRKMNTKQIQVLEDGENGFLTPKEELLKKLQVLT